MLVVSLQKSCMTLSINVFKDLVEKCEITYGGACHMECYWFCFNRVIQRDLDLARFHWTTRQTRFTFFFSQLQIHQEFHA